MRRREFIAGLCSAAVWPVAARAQQGERVRRIGIMSAVPEGDADFRARFAVLRQGLQQLGWDEGRNVRFDLRLGGAGNLELVRKHALELIALAPDVVVSAGSPSVGALQAATRTVPIVFVGIVDPVGAGFVENLARPGGNTTGFTSFEYGLSAKWLELLKEVAPRVARVAVLRDPGNPAGIGLLAAMQGVAPGLSVELTPISARDAGEIERGITAFARGPNDGLVATLGAPIIAHRELISTLASRQRLPAVYPYRYFVTAGGLISYGPNTIDPYRQGAIYVDRILRGEKPADLPVQAPTKYELAINLKTAKALGITVPATMLGRADEVIE